MSRRQFLLLILPLLLVLLGFVALHLFDRVGGFGAPSWDGDFAESLRRQMDRDFVFGLGDEKQQELAYFAAMNAYLRHYDAYGAVVRPDLVEIEQEESSGQYVGIGVRLDVNSDPNAAVLTGIAPGGPADKAGLRVGDRLVEVGGKKVAGLIAGDLFGPLRDAIKGEAGSDVKLGVESEDGVVRTVSVTRGAVTSGSIFGARLVDREQGIAYVRISQFHRETSAQLRTALARLSDLGARSLILDLRQNPGGFLDQAVSVADLFLEKQGDAIVRQVGRSDFFTRTAHATSRAMFVGKPMVVLVDRGSASASEVLAGALQDHRRAVILGEQTYGKFLVQQMTSERTRYGRVLFKRTCAIYLTPSGHFYPRRDREDALAGIPPDFVISLDNTEVRRLLGVFEDETTFEWNPKAKPRDPDFEDRQILAASSILAGDSSTTRIRSAAAPH